MQFLSIDFNVRHLHGESAIAVILYVANNRIDFSFINSVIIINSIVLIDLIDLN